MCLLGCAVSLYHCMNTVGEVVANQCDKDRVANPQFSPVFEIHTSV